MPTDGKAVVLIPARWASTRFPGKPLAKILDKPMIQWVVERARQAERVSEVIVATDDQRIFDAVVDFGGKAAMTAAHHVSGSDRIAEVAEGLDCDMIVNVQGDEPLIPPENIDRVIQSLVENPTIPVSTLMIPVQSSEEVLDPNIVKVVGDQQGRAMYFSRSPIPFHRDEWGADTLMRMDDRRVQDSPGQVYKHVGIYGYTRSFLLEFTRMKPTPMEMLEKLEQLRILENGHSIRVIETECHSIGVDRVEDLEKIERLMRQS